MYTAGTRQGANHSSIPNAPRFRVVLVDVVVGLSLYIHIHIGRGLMNGERADMMVYSNIVSQCFLYIIYTK